MARRAARTSAHCWAIRARSASLRSSRPRPAANAPGSCRSADVGLLAPRQATGKGRRGRGTALRRAGRRRRARSRGPPPPAGAPAAATPRARRRSTPSRMRRCRLGAACRSTPPEPTSRPTSRRSLPVRSTTRPSGPTTTRERPTCRRTARVAAADGELLVLVALGLRGRQEGRVLGPAYGRGPEVLGQQAGLDAGLPGAQRAPPHPEVALDGAGDRRAGHDLAREAGVLRVEAYDGVHVGGGAADVDDHDIRRPTRPRAPRHR